MDGRFDSLETALKQAEDGLRGDIIGGRAGTASQKQEGDRVEIAGTYHRLRDAQAIIGHDLMPRDLKAEVREPFHGEFSGTVLALPGGAAGGDRNHAGGEWRVYSTAPICNGSPLP